MDEDDTFRASTTRWLFGSFGGWLTLLLIPVGLGILIALSRWLTNVSTRYALTPDRLVLASGLIMKRIDEVELYRIKDVRVDFSLINQLADIGTISITSTDPTTRGGVLTLRDIPQARARRQAIRDRPQSPPQPRPRNRQRIGDRLMKASNSKLRLAARIAAAAILLLATAAPAQRVYEAGGRIGYEDAAGRRGFLTDTTNNSDPVLSPDGHTAVYVHLDARATEEGGESFSSLWAVNVATRETRRVLAPRPSDEPEANLVDIMGPVFSLDGGYVYVMAVAWTTSHAVHQINVATGATRFVAPGNAIRVMRNGPYRGYLLLGQHKYRDTPEGPRAYDVTDLIRPDGTRILTVPNSEHDEDADVRWLREKGWRAW